MTLSTLSDGRSVPLAALRPVVLITILLFALGSWTFIAGHPEPDARLILAAAEKSAGIGLIVFALLTFIRWAGPAAEPRWVGPGLVARVVASVTASQLMVAVGFLGGFGRDFHLSGAVVGGLLYGVTAGASMAVSRTQWLHHTLNRLALAARGRASWALMAFLADAHTVYGVLRQDGASHQFRHLSLQRRLATTHATQRRTRRERS